MNLFGIYFMLGLEHIADLKGYDHILFLLVLSAAYAPRQWKKLLILITAFTLGHSLTLALATFDLVRISPPLVEFLIPVTIFLTALSNLFYSGEKKAGAGGYVFRYGSALFFGLVHGLGFSNFLRAMLGTENNFTGALFSFNLGIEAGQVIIVALLMFVFLLTEKYTGMLKREWTILLSGAGMGISLLLIAERAPF